MMQKVKFFVLFLMLSGAALGLLQVWFGVFDEQMFAKVVMTYAILFVTAFAAFFWVKQMDEEEQLKKDKYID